MHVQTLLLAIVQREDADAATSALNQSGLGVTRLSTMGGFLTMGNVTLLIGLPHEEVNRAIALLNTECHARQVFVNAGAHVAEAHTPAFISPMEAEIGGAILFALPVERHIRFGEYYKIEDSQTDGTKGGHMKLLLVIVPEERSSGISNALIPAGYRVTLISTTGGFWRRGNATLLIGVESEKVDDVLERIREACATLPAQPHPAESCAIIFVLDVEQYARL